MRIGRLFAVSMLSVTVLAVILGAAVLVPQYRTFASKTEAIKTVQAYGAVLAVGQQVAGYRAPYVGPLFQEGAATPTQLEAAAKAAQVADAAFANARTVVGALSDGEAIVQGLNQAAARLADVRGLSDRALVLPMSGRDAAAIKGFLPGIAQVTAMIGGDCGCVADGAVECRPHGAGSAGLRRRPCRRNVACDQHTPSADGGRNINRRPCPGPR